MIIPADPCRQVRLRQPPSQKGDGRGCGGTPRPSQYPGGLVSMPRGPRARQAEARNALQPVRAGVGPITGGARGGGVGEVSYLERRPARRALASPRVCCNDSTACPVGAGVSPTCYEDFLTAGGGLRPPPSAQTPDRRARPADMPNLSIWTSRGSMVCGLH